MLPICSVVSRTLNLFTCHYEPKINEALGFQISAHVPDRMDRIWGALTEAIVAGMVHQPIVDHNWKGCVAILNQHAQLNNMKAE
jgi:hypothetical protein